MYVLPEGRRDLCCGLAERPDQSFRLVQEGLRAPPPTDRERKSEEAGGIATPLERGHRSEQPEQRNPGGNLPTGTGWSFRPKTDLPAEYA